MKSHFLGVFKNLSCIRIIVLEMLNHVVIKPFLVLLFSSLTHDEVLVVLVVKEELEFEKKPGHLTRVVIRNFVDQVLDGFCRAV